MWKSLIVLILLQMINGSVSAINFEWDKLSTDYIVEVEPPLGHLGDYQQQHMTNFTKLHSSLELSESDKLF